ncbi:MAG TPA: MFS transporter [Anaerolineae bacterium]|nr:MFS transporter [Anaerolineae bacterium]
MKEQGRAGQWQGTATETETRPTRAQWLTLLVLCAALLIIIVDVSIVNVTIPAIRQEFNASLADIEWINAVYALVFAAFIITWGRIGDEVGRRRIFIAGVVVFVIGSVLTGLGQSIPMILVGRFIQGFGAAMTSPSTLSILSTTFTGRMRGVAFGLWGATAGAAGAFGPLLGGFLTTYFSWRWAFLINLPIGLLAILGAYHYIKESKDQTRKHSYDLVGVVLAAVGFASVVFGLIEGQTYGWLTPTHPFAIGSITWPHENISIAPVAIIVGVIFLAAFVLYELNLLQRGQEPLFDFTLFRFTGFRYGLMTVMVVALGEFGIFFIFSIYLQVARELNAFQTGLFFLPFSIALFIAAPLAGALSSRFGPKWVVTSGMLCEALAIFLFSRILSIDVSLLAFIPVLLLYGVGVGLALAQLTNVTLSDVPPQQVGAASGANNTVRQVGAAIGIAILGAVMAAGISTTGKADLAAIPSIPAFVKAPLVQTLDQGLSGEAFNGDPSQQDSELGKAIKGVFNDAITEGVRSAATVAAVFVLLGALTSLLIPNKRSPQWARQTGEKTEVLASSAPPAH